MRCCVLLALHKLPHEVAQELRAGTVAGDVLSADEVESEAEAWRAETRRKIAAS